MTKVTLRRDQLKSSELHMLYQEPEREQLWKGKLQFWPPSANTLWRSYQGRNILSAKGRAFYENAVLQLRVHHDCDQLDGTFHVKLAFHPPDMRNRDLDNYIKPTLDALTKAGLWADDSAVKSIHAFFCEPKPKGLVRIEIYAHEQKEPGHAQ